MSFSNASISCRQAGFLGPDQWGAAQHASLNPPPASSAPVDWDADQQQDLQSEPVTQNPEGNEVHSQEVTISGLNIEDACVLAKTLQQQYAGRGFELSKFKLFFIGKSVLPSEVIPQPSNPILVCRVCTVRPRYMDDKTGLQKCCSNICYIVFNVNDAQCLNCHSVPRPLIKDGKKLGIFCDESCKHRYSLQSPLPSALSKQPPVQMVLPNLMPASASAAVALNTIAVKHAKPTVHQKRDVIRIGDIYLDFNNQIICQQVQDTRRIKSAIHDIIGKIDHSWFRRFRPWSPRDSSPGIQNQGPSNGYTVQYWASPDYPQTKLEKRTFHEKCDGNGANLLIVKLKDGSLFGAYTSRSWKSKGGPVTDPFAFIYKLNKPGSMGDVTFLPIRVSQIANAIFCSDIIGSVYGENDLSITLDGPDKFYMSCANLGKTFQLPSGIEYGSDMAKTFLAGSKDNWELDFLANLTVNVPNQ